MALEDLWYRKDRTKRPGYGKGLRWRVVWDDAGKRRSKSFANKDLAKAFQTSIDHQIRSGTYVSQANGKTLVRELLGVWESSLIRLKPSTLGEVKTLVRTRYTPKWGGTKVAEVKRRDVQEWVHELHHSGLAGRTVDTVYGWFRTFMTWCVDQGYLAVNPCQKIVLPRGHSKEHVYLTPAQVRALIDAMHPHYRLFTEFLVTTGARFGEAAELRVKDLDLPHRRANINRAVTRGVVGTPKSHKRRSVPLTEDITARLGESTAGRGREDLVFTTVRGAQLEDNNWRHHYFAPAAKAAKMPPGLTPHSLRHTTASLLARSGASIKALQTMLGHADAKITLQIYSGLYAEELDDLSLRLGGMLAATHVERKTPELPSAGAGS